MVLLARAVCAALVALGVVTPLAVAARTPTLAEREAIVHALPPFVRNAPVDCVWLKIRVSNGGRYAVVRPAYLNTGTARCARYAADGFFVLRKADRWRVIYVGSEFPPCSKRIPRGLIPCLP
jgi:hypothetical protein